MLHDAFVEAGWIADSINTKGEQSAAPHPPVPLRFTGMGELFVNRG
jgi:hypothetical protein